MNNLLMEKYTEILKDIDDKFLDPSKKKGTDYENLAGLFLTSVHDDYVNSKNKIMIVGRETRAWTVLKDTDPFTNLSDYIETSIEKHKLFFTKMLNGNNSKGASFHNFTRSIAAKCGKSGLIYSNLFCFSYKDSAPSKSKLFPKIFDYSEQLLKVQIEILKPNIILFMNGASSAQYRRQMFPVNGEAPVCSNFHSYEHLGVENKNLWSFDLYNTIKCYRMMHPSSYSKSAIQCREVLLDLLPEKC